MMNPAISKLAAALIATVNANSASTSGAKVDACSGNSGTSGTMITLRALAGDNRFPFAPPRSKKDASQYDGRQHTSDADKRERRRRVPAGRGIVAVAEQHGAIDGIADRSFAGFDQGQPQVG